jgi:hypothetical protein
MFVVSRISVEPNKRIVASAHVTPRAFSGGYVLIWQSTHRYKGALRLEEQQ